MENSKLRLGPTPAKSTWVATSLASFGYSSALFGPNLAIDGDVTDEGTGFNGEDEAAALITASYFMSRAAEEGGAFGDWMQVGIVCN